MKVKTYGVPGLTEWHGKVRAGSIEVQVSFKGGTASPSGAQPAYLTTKDPITQFVIENSKEFKRGTIVLMMQQDVPGEHPRMAVPKPAPAPKEDENPKGDANDGNAVVQEPEQPEVAEPSQGDSADSQAAADSQGEVADDGLQTVTVADKGDAVEWLKEHYPDKGYTATNLRTKAAFEAACVECGVKFEYTA